MAKFIVVTITRDTRPNMPTMQYPANYIPEVVGSYMMGAPLLDGAIAAGGNIAESLVLISDDAFADSLVTGSGGAIRAVIRVQADNWIQGNPKFADQPTEVITDRDRLQAIIAKNGAGIALSVEDLKALDPDDVIPGIRRRLIDAGGFFDNAPST